MRIDWKIGVEIELLAPPGSSREQIAHVLSARRGGTVRRVLHQDSEPSKVPGQPVFYNLTQGFEALDATGALIARCVDDVTLQHDLDKRASPKPGWWRMVSDDERLLRLLAIHSDAQRDLPEAIAGLAELFQGKLLPAPGGMYRLVDSVGAPLAIAAPLPGERERACELITPPLEREQAQALEALLSTARELGFSIPLEGATHIHFDASPLCDANIIANLVNLLETWGSRLRQLCGTPAHFRRVGGWPDKLRELVNQADFRNLPWTAAQPRLRALDLSKYTDFNLKNIAYARPDRHTFEARIFPAYTETKPVIAAAALMQGVLQRCRRTETIPPLGAAPWHLDEVRDLLDSLELDDEARGYWRARATSVLPQADVEATAGSAA